MKTKAFSLIEALIATVIGAISILAIIIHTYFLITPIKKLPIKLK